MHAVLLEVIGVKIRAVVDRIEGDVAVLLLGQSPRRIDWPLECLPPVHEGSVLAVHWEVEESEEAARKAQAADLLQRLLQRDKPGE